MVWEELEILVPLVRMVNQEMLVEPEMQVNQEMQDLPVQVEVAETVAVVVMVDLLVEQEMGEVLETQVVMLVKLVDLELLDHLVLLYLVEVVELVVEVADLVAMLVL